ncbi:MAG: sterol desaturase family protein, partial [Gemmatimonadales bacterium]
AYRFLWRFHAVHHSIRTVDWLAGSRLHLVDILVTRAFSYIPLYVLGFSQGCATVARWLTTTDYDVDRLILWGGILPPDLDAKTAQPRLRNAQLTLVIGKTDEYVSEPALKAEEGRLGQWGVPYELVRFDGGHHLSQTVLGELADRTERTA